MSESNELQPLFTLDLGDNGGLLAPRNLDELEGWIQREFWFWSNLSLTISVAQIRDGTSNLQNTSNIIADARRYLQPSQEAELARHLSGIEQNIRSAFVEKGLPHSSTSFFILLQDLNARHSKGYVSWFLAAYFGVSGYSPSSIEDWHGLRDGLNYRYPEQTIVSDAFRAQAQTFEALRDKTQRLLDESTISLSGLEGATSKLKSEFIGSIDGNKILFDGAQDKRATDFATALHAHEGQMQTIRETFKEKMGLRAPVDYWRRRSVRQGKWALGFGVAFAILLVVGGWLLNFETSAMLAKLKPHESPSAWILGRVAVFFVLAIWALRLVVRLFLSSLHTSNDAAERVVMTETYLSLMESDKLQNEDRQIILNALFRHSADGIVKDEGVPPGIAELLTRFGKP